MLSGALPPILMFWIDLVASSAIPAIALCTRLTSIPSILLSPDTAFWVMLSIALPMVAASTPVSPRLETAVAATDWAASAAAFVSKPVARRLLTEALVILPTADTLAAATSTRPKLLPLLPHSVELMSRFFSDFTKPLTMLCTTLTVFSVPPRFKSGSLA